MSFQIVGQAFDESTVLRVVDAYQRATDWHLRSPSLSGPEAERPTGRRADASRPGRETRR